jgi:hypothetical protein
MVLDRYRIFSNTPGLAKWDDARHSFEDILVFEREKLQIVMEKKKWINNQVSRHKEEPST